MNMRHSIDRSTDTVPLFSLLLFLLSLSSPRPIKNTLALKIDGRRETLGYSRMRKLVTVLTSLRYLPPGPTTRTYLA